MRKLCSYGLFAALAGGGILIASSALRLGSNEGGKVERPDATSIVEDAPPVGARIIFHAQTNPNQVAARMELDALIIQDVVQDNRSLWLLVEHRAASPSADPDRRGTVTPQGVLLVNDRPGPAINPRGAVGYHDGRPVWIRIPLGELPDGDLDLGLEAFGARGTFQLRNVGGRLEELPLLERVGVQVDGEGNVGLLSEGAAFVEVK